MADRLKEFAEMVRDLPVMNQNMPHGVWIDGVKHTGPLADWLVGEFLPVLKSAAIGALESTRDD
jgi:hypothetical protein